MAQQLSFAYDTPTEKVLSLCIPTYNRAHCLKEQFKRLANIAPEDRERMEIIVSDNCSTDNTPEVVAQYKDALNFQYLRNEENIGSNRNFIQCIQHASGKYVWLLGDDDYLQTTHIHTLLDQLATHDYGTIHLSLHSRPDKEPTFCEYDNLDDYISHVHVLITFMSANIDRTDLIRHLDLQPYAHTWIAQVPAHLEAAINSPTNLVVNLPFFDAGAEVQNNGGYNVFEVFVKHLVSIFERYEENKMSTHTLFVLKNRISDFIFPYFLNHVLLKKPCNFQLKGAWAIMKQYLGVPRILWSATQLIFSPRMILHWIQKVTRPVGRILTFLCTHFFVLIWPPRLSKAWTDFQASIVSNRFRLLVKKAGKPCGVYGWDMLTGAQYITVGNGFSALKGLRIECIPQNGKEPILIIGNHVTLNARVHIGVTNKVTIGHHVLIGSDVLITDHSHGTTDDASLALPPRERPLWSKGPVVIEDNVWIGDKACILPGVTIGKGAVIGAGAVVTSSVAPGDVVAGVPAKSIKP